MLPLLSLLALLPTADPAPIVLTSPVPRQVIQRVGVEPRLAHAHAPGGAKRGHGPVAIRGMLPAGLTGDLQWRTTTIGEAPKEITPWQALTATIDSDRAIQASVNVPAGGWYRLEVRVVKNDQAVAAGTVEPFGIGEVLMIAGQSYAAGANDELLRVEDPQQRVVRLDWIAKSWQVAHDPQPHVDNGGTIWPPLGDWLVTTLQVPMAFVNVAVGGTSSAQWQPEGELYPRLREAGRQVGNFRAVLWQQGESDVIVKTSLDQYVANIRTLRSAAEKDWGFAPPWLLAKSTLHPTVYNDPEGELRIRTAIDQLASEPGFAAGPDTDLLDGEHRGPIGSRRHFTGKGQRTAAVMWFTALWPHLMREKE